MNSIEPRGSSIAGSAPPFATADGKARRSSGKFWLGALIIAIIAVVAWYVGHVPRAKNRVALVAETRELATPTVSVTSAAPGKASAGQSHPAEVRPYAEAAIYARASGYLKRWLVDIGGHVEPGQLLAEIDTPEINQELARTRAELAQAEANLALSKATADRWEGLLKTASVSEQEALEKKSDLALKVSTVEAARANVRRLEQMEAFARVTAPFAGTVTMRKTDVGELISATGGKELFRLEQINKLRVYVRVPQVIARSVEAGQTAELTLPELTGRTFAAKVVRTSGAMTADSRTLLVELELDNAKGEILAGSFARVRFTDAKPDATLTLPSNTLIFRGSGTQVGVVTKENKVELRPVTIGRDFGPSVEIFAGVTPEDRVILNPTDSLVNGAAVRVAEGKKE